MRKIFRIALMAATLAGFTGVAQAVEVETAPEPTQDPIVQQLKLNNDQITKIKALHKQLEADVFNIPTDSVKNGSLINVIQSGKWDEKAVREQLAAFSHIEEQARYYRIKYYFDVSQILTPEQRAEVRSQFAQAMSR